MTTYRDPFNRPGLAGNELRYIRESVDSGRISGDGVFTEKCRRLLEDLLGARRVLLTTLEAPAMARSPWQKGDWPCRFHEPRTGRMGATEPAVRTGILIGRAAPASRLDRLSTPPPVTLTRP